MNPCNGCSMSWLNFHCKHYRAKSLHNPLWSRVCGFTIHAWHPKSFGIIPDLSLPFPSRLRCCGSSDAKAWQAVAADRFSVARDLLVLCQLLTFFSFLDCLIDSTWSTVLSNLVSFSSNFDIFCRTFLSKSFRKETSLSTPKFMTWSSKMAKISGGEIHQSYQGVKVSQPRIINKVWSF
jgi:hypothetical protein